MPREHDLRFGSQEHCLSVSAVHNYDCHVSFRSRCHQLGDQERRANSATTPSTLMSSCL